MARRSRPLYTIARGLQGNELRCPAVVESLKEAGDELFAFLTELFHHLTDTTSARASRGPYQFPHAAGANIRGTECVS